MVACAFSIRTKWSTYRRPTTQRRDISCNSPPLSKMIVAFSGVEGILKVMIRAGEGRSECFMNISCKCKRHLLDTGPD